jgi:hypothetical protein
MRKLSVVVSIAAAMALAGTAVAAGPVGSEAVFDFPDPEVYTECDGYDVVLSDMHIERRSLTWYDTETPVLERRHASFSGTFTNSVTGKTGAFAGQLGLEFDFASSRLTLTGLLRQVKVPGQPPLLATGLDVTDANEDLLFQAGQPLGDWEEALCGYMA